MSTYNNVKYRSLPQQVQKNKEDILSNQTANEAIHLEMDEINAAQNQSIENLDTAVEGINETLASGGINVNRRIEDSTAYIGIGSEEKLSYDLTSKESNDLNIIGFNVNNDHVLKLAGDYSVGAGFNVVNGIGTNKDYSLLLVAIDEITLSETVLDSRIGTISSNSTLPINPTYIYTRPAGNNIILEVRVDLEVGVTIEANSHLTVTSLFTVGGAGIATKDINIGLDDAANSALEAGNVNQGENNLSLFKMIEIDASDNFLLKDPLGTKKLEIRATGPLMQSNISGNGYKITGIGDPTSAQDAVTKAFMEKLIRVNGIDVIITNGTTDILKIKGADGNVEFLAGNKRIVGMEAPVDNLDAVNFITLKGSDGVIGVGTNITKNSGKVLKSGNQMIMNVNFTTSGVIAIDDTILSLPASYRPTSTIMGFAQVINSALRYAVQISSTGIITTKESIASGVTLTIAASMI